MSGIRRFFPVDKEKTSPKKQAQLSAPRSQNASQDTSVLDLLDSSDDDFSVVDVKPTKQEPKEQVQPANVSTKETKTRANDSKDLKSITNEKRGGDVKPGATKSTPKSVDSGNAAAAPGKGASAAEVLASIPSVDLPSVGDAKPNFRQIMSRQDTNSGMEIEAAPNCLTGLTFVVTGQLPRLGRDEIQNLIKRYGGHVTSSLSGKTSCLVLGEDAGPAKIQKARNLKLKVIDEEGFLELLRAMPADGGSGDAAEKARMKREREQKQVELEAKRFKQDHKSQPPSSKSAAGEAGQAGPDPGAQMWTSKYAPHSLSDICGNNAAVQRLSKWLQNWRAARNGQSSEGSDFRAAMLSGPPGIGKTTAAHLMGNLQGFDVVEYNASDTRSKSLLNSQVSQTLSNRTLAKGGQIGSSTRPLMVVMDEVDGMSGGDRGGVGAMAALARTTNVPLVLICNERTLPKMRPFDRVVFDIQFRRPDASQVRHRLMSIARAEGLELDSSSIEQLVAATRSDIRQMLNLLETYRTTKSKMDYDGSRKFSQSWNKELVLKPFDIAARLLSRNSQTSMSTNERMELYFHDYDFAPLMIQENYLVTAPSLEAAAQAAESISDGDLVDRLIHGPQQQWSLMPQHALLSCVRPSYAAAGQARGRFNFTAFLGNNSKGTKYRRLLAELRSHIRLRLPANAVDLRLEFQPLLAFLLLSPLLKSGADAIPDVIEFMDAYFITKEDWDVVMELGVGTSAASTTEAMAKKLPTAVKTAFTRKYNAASHPLPFMKAVDTKAAAVKKTEAPDLEDVILEDEVNEEPEVKEDDLESAMKNDKYIKKGKPKAKPKPKTKAPAKPRAKKATK